MFMADGFRGFPSGEGANAGGDAIMCSVERTSSQVMGTSWTDMTFPTENVDTDEMHDTSSNTERVTINTAGKYLVVGSVTKVSSSSYYSSARLCKNGSTQLGPTHYDAAGTNDNYFASMTNATIVELVVGDYITLQVMSNFTSMFYQGSLVAIKVGD